MLTPFLVRRFPNNCSWYNKEIRLLAKTKGKYMIWRRNPRNWKSSNTFWTIKSKNWRKILDQEKAKYLRWRIKQIWWIKNWKNSILIMPVWQSSSPSCSNINKILKLIRLNSVPAFPTRMWKSRNLRMQYTKLCSLYKTRRDSKNKQPN